MIELINIHKSYGQKVLSGVSLALENGVTCVMGASGSGKTTLMRIAAGLEPPDSGEVRGISGKRLAIVFQEDRLLPWASALNNVRFVTGRESRSRAEEMLQAVGLAGSMHKRVTELSGGMKRRVAIARALAADSDALLLDEPFAGLDDATKRSVMELVLFAALIKPVMVITHDISEARELNGRIYKLG